MRAFFAVLILCAASALSPVSARAEDPIDTTRTMIEAQINAFLKDDAETA